MKILHILFTNDLGGAERAMATLAQAQSKAGHTIRVLIRPSKKDINIKNWLNTLQVAEVSTFFQTWHIRKHVEAFEPDIIHTHLGNAGKAVKKLDTKIPCVAILHMDYKSKQHAHLTGLIAVNSAQIQNAKTCHYTGKMVEIPMLVAPMKPAARQHIQTLRTQYTIPQKHIIGSVARLHANKGMAELITAFQQADLGADVGLVIVGDGVERAALNKLAKDDKRIHLVGLQTDLAPWYGLFDVYVSASYSETFGLTLLEAMQAGCPIISTKTAGAQAVLAGQGVTFTAHATLCDTLQACEFAGGRSTYDLARFSANALVAEVVGFYEEILVDKK